MIHADTIYYDVAVITMMYGFDVESRANYCRFGIMLLMVKYVLSVQLAGIG